MTLTVARNFWGRFPERYNYLIQSFELCNQRLDLSGLTINYLMTAETDGIDQAGKDKLTELCQKYNYTLLWHEKKADLGANLNFLIDNIKDDIFFYIQDDYAPESEILDIKTDVEYLATHDNLGLIRYPYHGGFCERPELVRVSDRYFCIPHFSMSYRYSDNPHLQHKRWINTIGRYAEYIGPTMSENDMDGRSHSCPLEIYVRDLPKAFVHIGTTSTVPEKWA